MGRVEKRKKNWISGPRELCTHTRLADFFLLIFASFFCLQTQKWTRLWVVLFYVFLSTPTSAHLAKVSNRRKPGKRHKGA